MWLDLFVNSAATAPPSISTTVNGSGILATCKILQLTTQTFFSRALTLKIDSIDLAKVIRDSYCIFYVRVLEEFAYPLG